MLRYEAAALVADSSPRAVASRTGRELARRLRLSAPVRRLRRLVRG